MTAFRFENAAIPSVVTRRFLIEQTVGGEHSFARAFGLLPASDHISDVLIAQHAIEVAEIPAHDAVESLAQVS